MLDLKKVYNWKSAAIYFALFGFQLLATSFGFGAHSQQFLMIIVIGLYTYFLFPFLVLVMSKIIPKDYWFVATLVAYFFMNVYVVQSVTMFS